MTMHQPSSRIVDLEGDDEKSVYREERDVAARRIVQV